MRLIDADALKQIAQDHGFNFVDLQALDNALTIDAVPVIRCKECKRWTGVALGSRCKHFSFAPLAYCYTNPDDFCSRGERKDGDSNDKA